MNNTNNITFLIPNRGGKHIDFVIEQLKHYWNNAKYIVITQDDDLPFMRGQLFNIGVKFVDSEYVCFIDNDMFFKTYVDLIDILNKTNGDAVQPFSHIEQVELNNNTYNTIEISPKSPGACGGCTFVNTHKFKELNGMSNLYIGWGKEDNEFSKRFNLVDFKNNICHIKHQKRINNNIKNTELNKQLYNSRNLRNKDFDGYMQTTCDVISDTYINDIRYINVTNIYVTNDFKYKNLLASHYE